MQSIYLVGRGLIIEANIPVQEREGQRGEGAYFRRGLIFGRIRYTCISTVMIHRMNSHLLPLALTGREGVSSQNIGNYSHEDFGSGLSSSETHSESEKVTEKGIYNQNRGGGC